VIPSLDVELYCNARADGHHSADGRLRALPERDDSLRIRNAALGLFLCPFVEAGLWGVDPYQSQKLSVLSHA
jgi:hypothetical protein